MDDGFSAMEDTGTFNTHCRTTYSTIQSIMMNRIAGGMDANVSAARPEAMLIFLPRVLNLWKEVEGVPREQGAARPRGG
jgi:hypothetical protein